MANEESVSTQEVSFYRQIGQEVLKRTTKPLKHPSFVAFFVIAVLVFGAMGIWVELLNYVYGDSQGGQSSTEAIRTAVLTFFPAVAGTAAMQLIWAETPKHFRSSAFLVFALFLVVALLILPDRVSNASALWVGGFASLGSVWVWWIANANQVELLDKVSTTAPVGGDKVDVKLGGSLDDFQH